MIKQKRSQPGKFFSAARPAGTTMQAARHHIAVACVLIADRGVDDQDSAVQVPDSKHNILNKTRII